LTNSTLVHCPDEPDEVNANAREVAVRDLPNDVLVYLLNSRYCEVDRLSKIALELFGQAAPGWGRVQAICDWVHDKVEFNYQHARPTKTALDVYTERVGVCRDYQHLAITFCRALNIPARYATGYLGEFACHCGCPWTSARGLVYLNDRWWTLTRAIRPDCAHLMATGRTPDVALNHPFGRVTWCTSVVSEEESEPQKCAERYNSDANRDSTARDRRRL
jgi:transglutaminase-like putative cysteine protease